MIYANVSQLVRACGEAGVEPELLGMVQENLEKDMRLLGLLLLACLGETQSIPRITVEGVVDTTLETDGGLVCQFSGEGEIPEALKKLDPEGEWGEA